MRSPALDVELIRTRHLASDERRAAERAVHRGHLVRLRSGVLVRPGSFESLRPADRHLLLIRASLPRFPERAVVGIVSAGAVHGLPHVGTWPAKVHLLEPGATRTTVTAWFVRHGVDADLLRRSDPAADIPASDLVRTLTDIAATERAVNAVAAIDHALHGGLVTTAMLLDELERVHPKAHARARRAIEMGSARSDSPAESVARVRFRQLGAPEPTQQHEFSRAGERRAVVDFWFPDQGVVVEIDGRTKYEDPGMLAGTTTADAHWQEKRREDFLRSFDEVRHVVRFSWADLMQPEVVRAALVRAGVPCR